MRNVSPRLSEHRVSMYTESEMRLAVILASMRLFNIEQQVPFMRHELTRDGKPKSYIVDFLINDSVIVEVDGESHRSKDYVCRNCGYKL